MRVFVSEYVCGGGWPEPQIGGSLANEGRAMLQAIVDDLSRIAGVEVTTTWDARLGPAPFRNARVVRSSTTDHERQHFERLAVECEATFVIAPELGGVLHQRCQVVEAAGGRLLGPRSRAVALCADKFRLAEHLRSSGVSTIPTELWDPQSSRPEQGSAAGLPYPIVIKPRDGAGSQCTKVIGGERDLEQFENHVQDVEGRAFVVQPYLPGTPCSVALLFSSTGREVEVFPPAEQLFSDDGSLTYRGGRVPIGNVDRAALEEAALVACRTVPGLRGYVGVDLIVPVHGPARPVVVEINPRLTTSYLGYRALAAENLAEWLLLPARFRRGVQWRSRRVEFDASGRILS